MSDSVSFLAHEKFIFGFLNRNWQRQPRNGAILLLQTPGNVWHVNYVYFDPLGRHYCQSWSILLLVVKSPKPNLMMCFRLVLYKHLRLWKAVTPLYLFHSYQECLSMMSKTCSQLVPVATRFFTLGALWSFYRSQATLISLNRWKMGSWVSQCCPCIYILGDLSYSGVTAIKRKQKRKIVCHFRPMKSLFLNSGIVFGMDKAQEHCVFLTVSPW